MVLPKFFEKIAIYWFLEGSGHLKKFRAPADKNNLTPKESKKKVEIFMCVAVSKNDFSSKRERFFRLWPLVPPIGAVRTERT